MKRAHVILLGLVLSIVFASSAFAQLSAPQFADSESAVEKVVYIESGKLLYDYSWNLTKTTEGQKTLIKINAKGKWFGTEVPVPWTEESIMELTPNGLRTLSWKKESTGPEQESWKMTYDWAGKNVHYWWKDRASGKTKEKDIALSANALAGASMFFAMRGFPFEKGVGTEYTGKIIDSSGMVYTGSMILRSEETLKTALGEIETYKIELKPKGLAGIVSPDMFIWYTKAAPHVQVRFEGRDNGLTSPRTHKLLLKFTPSEAVK